MASNAGASSGVARRIVGSDISVIQPFSPKAKATLRQTQRNAALVIASSYRTAANASMSSCVVAQLVQKRTTV